MTGARLSGSPIVCVGFAEWDAETPTNQHQLMARLARDSPVLFVESLGLRRPTATARDLRRMARRAVRGLRPLRREAYVHVLSPLVVPYHGLVLVRRLNERLLRRFVTRATRALGFDAPILWTYVPQAIALVDALQPRLLVYHCVDDIAAHDRIDSASFRRAEEALVRKADLVIVSSQPLYDRLSRYSERVCLMPNVADTDAFAGALEPGHTDPFVEALPRPRIVFVGAVSAVKVDLQLLRELARLRRDWSIVLVGPVGLGDPGTDVSELQAEPNVHLLGPRAHEELPAVLRGADAGIIPYRINELTSSVFPMKVYEYLAAGLPTVSTPLPALAGVDGIVFAADASAMCEWLERLLAQDTKGLRSERSRLASGHSWAARLTEIEDAVSELEWRR